MDTIIKEVISIVRDYSNSPLLLYISLLGLSLRYVFRPINRIINRSIVIVEEYFAVHEREIGNLQKLCDRLDAVIKRLDAPKAVTGIRGIKEMLIGWVDRK